MEKIKLFGFFMEGKPIGLKMAIVVMILLIHGLADPVNLFAQSQFSIVGDPSFNKNNLSPEMLLWYERLWKAINDPTESPDADREAATNDTYRLGRIFGDYIAALIAAFRATGDLKILDEADRLMEITRGKLRDTNGDGYLNWVWTVTSDPNYYNKDVHEMDEIMTHGNVAMMTYALYSNAHLKSSYAKHADFWIDYMENHWIAKWEKRGGIEKTLAHPFTNHMRLYYYMYKVTGKTVYLNEAEKKEKRFADHIETSPKVSTAFIWRHHVGEPNDDVQPVNYAHYVMVYIMELAMEGFGRFASDEYMEHYASTWRDLVYNNGNSSMADRIDGSSSRGFILYNNAGLARWDKTKKLFDLAEKAYNPRLIHVPAYMLMVLSNRSGGGNDGANKAPIAKITTDVIAGEAPLTVHFDGSKSTDDDGFIKSYVWNFGDGQTSQTQNPPPHTFATVGQYRVTLAVTDDGGAVGRDSVTVSVVAPGVYTYIYLEAENGKIISPMQIGRDNNASAGAYIYTPAGTRNTTSPAAEAIYQINLAKNGWYHLWMRTYAPTSSNDATYIGFNGSFMRVFPKNTNIYEWVKAGDAHLLNAGANQINIGHAEAQARVDRLLITDNSTFTPEATNTLPTATIALSDPSPTKAGTVQVILTTSKIVTKIPTPLSFIESDKSTTTINLSGPLPGNIFTGVFLVDDKVADGVGYFTLPGEALVDENGSKGNAINSGAYLRIDKTPPAPPQTVKVSNDWPKM